MSADSSSTHGTTQPAAGCSPGGGLPRSQGRRARLNGGPDKEVVRAPVPGELPADFLLNFYNALHLLGMAGELIAERPDAFSLMRCWELIGQLERVVFQLRATATRSLKNDFPPVIRGYKGIPE
jgi:hypothetical protein